MEGTIGEIRMFAGTFAPRAWAFCAGQLLSIAQNTALFSILGTTYGGNGQTTFALPDLRGRSPIGAGQGPGLSNISLGEVSGVENVTILTSQMPAHTHTATATVTGTVAPGCLDDAGTTDAPGGARPAISPGGTNVYSTATPDASMATSPINATATVTIGIAGSSQPLPIRNPYLGMNYIICLEGIFPSRN
ncbi:MAG TPA: tail fiber protein [Chitinophagaceae bacterium]|nr:tail fiber protein [Chitinophagaceae bacterium]